MVIVKIHEGLGNQMFQYAYARALSLRGVATCIDSSIFVQHKPHGGYGLSHYAIQLPDIYSQSNHQNTPENQAFLLALHTKYQQYTQLREASLSFNSQLFSPPDNSFLLGFFQSEKYFADIRPILLQEFKIQSPISAYSQQIAQQISACENAVAIHIRRGDYIDAQNIQVHGFCGVDYYCHALELLNQQQQNLQYFIFSNDMAWCQQHIQLPNTTYIESQTPRLPHEDIYLMSLCKHHIIANSSFSWWGAWLCEQPNKTVIAPARWFADDKLEAQSQDIVCADWIRLS